MSDQTLRINEIFYSIQGESTRSGEPCIFVRLRGCHLRCHYCDTEYAFTEGSNLTIDRIMETIRGWNCTLVQITGGEPLLQENVHDLIKELCDDQYTVLIETSGACDVSSCDDRAILILDIKTPGSGEHERMNWDNLKHVRPVDEIKFVITDRGDYEWARDLIATSGIDQKVNAILFSPVFEQAEGTSITGTRRLEPDLLAAWILEDHLKVKMQLQLHKFIWHPSTRGV